MSDPFGTPTGTRPPADAAAAELAGHAGELDLAVRRLVGHAQQRAMGTHLEAETVGGDGGRLHVEGDGARLRQPADDGMS
jgi:hypothetical protein